MSTTQLSYEDVLSRLEGVKRRSRTKAQAKCPAHDDSDPSMTVAEGKSCILLHCFAGCSFEDIVKAMGLEPQQLLYEMIDGTVIRKPSWVREAAELRQMNLAAADE